MADFWNEKPEQGGFFEKQLKKKLPARKMAERLMKQGEQDGSTQIVSGYAVKKSPLEGLAKALTAELAGIKNEKQMKCKPSLIKTR